MSRQRQLVLPLLESLDAAGGRARTGELYDAVAEKAEISGEDRTSRRSAGGRSVNVFEHHVRWAQQQAKAQGLVRPIGGGDWVITGRGKEILRKAKPGVMVTLFMTQDGIALWGSCEDAMTVVDDESVHLLLTSPPYPLVTPRAYGNEDQASWIDWFLRLAEQWIPKLAPGASMVVNLGSVWIPGTGRRSDYVHRLVPRLADALGLHLVNEFVWENPAKLANAHWVARTRIHVRDVTETFLWLSPHDAAATRADNRAVLVAYSDAMRRLLDRGGERAAARPSGWQHRDGAFSTDNGGAIATNLLRVPNTVSNSDHHRACRAAGLPLHPARMPEALAEFFIRYLTRSEELVCDPFGGSGTTAAAAERLGRRWIICEIVREYLEGARLRFQERPACC